MRDVDTQTRILDAAEQAFARGGFEATSLRHIIADAGVNLAAIHYHFGSKEALIEAVFARRIGPLNAERLALLDAIEAKAGRRPLPLNRVIEALVAPGLRLARDPDRGGAVVMRLFGRTIAEPTEALQAMFARQFREVMERFMNALRRTLPSLPPSVLYWRFHFMIGSMAHVLCAPVEFKKHSGGLCDVADTETIVRQLVTFLTAGMKAPAPKQPPPPEP